MTTHVDNQSIVVGIDGSSAALAAARWAGAVAARQHAPLVLVSVVPAADVRLTAAAIAESDLLPALRAAAKRRVAEVVAAVRHDQPELRITESVVDGTPARELIAASGSARLVVVGASADDRFATLLLGSTALLVANKAACPVVVWRGHRDRPLPDQRPVLVGVDGSPDSEAAVGQAFEVASLLGAGVIALHSWNDPDLLRWNPPADAWEILAQQEQELLSERLAGWCEKYPDVVVTQVLQKGPTAQALLEHAADAQLIVTGSHGHNRLTGLLLGSTSQNLLHHAPCPALICRVRD